MPKEKSKKSSKKQVQEQQPALQPQIVNGRLQCPLAAFHPFPGFECLTCKKLNGEDITHLLEKEDKLSEERRKKKELKRALEQIPKQDVNQVMKVQTGVDGIVPREDFIPSWMKSSMKK